MMKSNKYFNTRTIIFYRNVPASTQLKKSKSNLVINYFEEQEFFYESQSDFR